MFNFFTLQIVTKLKISILILATSLLVIPLAVTPSFASTKVRVGIYQDFPLVFADSEGNAQGVYVDVLDHIAVREDWDIEYIACTWADCLLQVESGAIDTLTAIAYSKERTQKYDFNDQTVFPNWGQVYSNPIITIDSIGDLAGKTVAGLKGDIYFTELKEVAGRTNLDVTYIDVEEYEEVFRLLERGDVETGILPRLFGDLNENRFNVQKTTTIIRPSELRFAFPKGSKQALISKIDKHLSGLKADKNSLYFQSISKWLGPQGIQQSPEVELSKSEKIWLDEHREILLGVDPNFVPFEFIETDGSYRGMCADYVKIIGTRTGMSVKVAEGLNWNQVISQAKNKQIDVLPCVGMTEERKEFLTYSDPHQSFFRVVVTQEGSNIGNSLDALQQVRVAVQKNSSHHGFFKDNTKIAPLLFETAEEAIMAVSNGRVDAFVGNENMSGYTINTRGIVNLKMERLAGSVGNNLYFAVRSDWPELVSIINKGLASISNKEREAIKQKWIAVRVEKHIDYTLMAKWAGVVLSAVIILVFWNLHMRRQKRRLQESEEKFRNIVEGLHEGYFFYSHDSRGIFTYMSPSVESILGYSAQEMMVDFGSILTDNPINHTVKESTDLCLKGVVQPAYTVEVRHKDNSNRWLEVSEIPVVSSKKRVVGVEGIAHDITEKITIEAELRKAKNDAEAASKAKSTFLANMSHELRTPLNAILGFSELMTNDSNLSLKQKGNLEIIERSGAHLLGLIDDILEISKIEAGKSKLRLVHFDLHHLLFIVKDMLSLRVQDKGLSMVMEGVSEVPQFIRADQGKLRQSLINLLENAIKFTNHGVITLRVSVEDTTLCFEIEDTGVGIEQEGLITIFEVFGQTENGEQENQGSGLGIPISHEFIRMMGGELTVESEKGEGTIFRFSIQIEVTKESEVVVDQPGEMNVTIELEQKDIRMLVAEDTDSSRKLIVTILTGAGFNVREAKDGQEAVDLWEEWQPHLIWMDMRMPILNGTEATKIIKSKDAQRSTPINTKIIALTAGAFKEDKINALESGCDDYLKKPYRMANIFTMMKKHLNY